MAELKFTLEYGECNGHMTVQCYANDVLIAEPLIKDTDNHVTITAQVDLPVDLVIKVSGKNLNTDTLVENEKIVKDKYVKLKQIFLSRYPVNEVVLHNLCQFIPEHKSVEYGNFFYCNGTAVVPFRSSDALHWHLSQNRYY
jgi:hypothetical protein